MSLIIPNVSFENPLPQNLDTLPNRQIINQIKWFYRLDQIKKQIADKQITISQACLSKKNYNYFRYACFDSWNNEQLINLIKSGDCIYEDFLISKPYVDFEVECNIKTYQNNPKTYDSNILKKMGLLVEYIGDAFVSLTGSDDFEIKITKSHGIITKNGIAKYKFSYHFVVHSNTYRFRNSTHAKQLVYIIKNRDNVDKNAIKYINMSVYKKDQKSLSKMRCIYSKKISNDTRTLVPIDIEGNTLVLSDDEIKKYLISHTENENEIKFIEDDKILKKIESSDCDTVIKNGSDICIDPESDIKIKNAKITERSEESILLTQFLQKHIESAKIIDANISHGSKTYYTYH